MTADGPKPDAPPRIAILPLGATEQHGPHLPAATDSILAEAIVSRALTRFPAAGSVEVLPVENVGYSIEHADFGGTRSLDWQEAIDRWIGIGAAVARRGTRRLVMVNAHGGNAPLMTVVATELRVRHAMLAVATSWTRFGWPEGLVDPVERAYGIHGGFIETSAMLALRPDLVDMDKAADFPSAQAEYVERFRHLRAYGPHAFGWTMRDLSPLGVTGNAAAASAAAGERLLDHAADGIAALLADVLAFDLSRFD